MQDLRGQDVPDPRILEIQDPKGSAEFYMGPANQSPLGRDQVRRTDMQLMLQSAGITDADDIDKVYKAYKKDPQGWAVKVGAESPDLLDWDKEQKKRFKGLLEGTKKQAKDEGFSVGDMLGAAATALTLGAAFTPIGAAVGLGRAGMAAGYGLKGLAKASQVAGKGARAVGKGALMGGEKAGKYGSSMVEKGAARHAAKKESDKIRKEAMEEAKKRVEEAKRKKAAAGSGI